MTPAEQLVERLNKARDQYFKTGESDLSDDEYDALKTEVERLGLTVSPFETVQYGTKTRRHFAQMPSMEEEKNIDQRGNQEGWLSLKYDGLALELQYIDGRLDAAVLRGDGSEGEVVTHNARWINGVPQDIKNGSDYFAVYGEVVISWNNLIVLNEMREQDGEKPYKTPRNAASYIRSSSTSAARMRLFTFRPYGTFPPLHGAGPYDQMLTLKFAVSTVFNPVRYVPQLIEAKRVRGIMHDNDRSQLAYQVDGMVFRPTDGTGPFKIKYPAESGVTTVVGVTEQLGRTGVISPVVELEPITLGGVTVKRATGHNVELMASRLNGLGIGARVVVSRRGDVIPHVETVAIPADNPWTPRHDCPSCGHQVVQDGSIRRCGNDQFECPGTRVGLLSKFCKARNMLGFGPGILHELARAEIVTTPADLFKLDVDTLAYVEDSSGRRLGEATAMNLVAMAEKRSRMTFGELLGALGIPGCSDSIMANVAGVYDETTLQSATVSSLHSVDGVGATRAVAISDYIDEHWGDTIEPLLEVITLTKPRQSALTGKSVCITLALRRWSREEAHARIIAAGGTVKTSVTRDTAYLVCNDPAGATSKIATARKYGVPVIDEETLVELLGDSAEQIDIAPNPNDEF